MPRLLFGLLLVLFSSHFAHATVQVCNPYSAEPDKTCTIQANCPDVDPNDAGVGNCELVTGVILNICNSWSTNAGLVCTLQGDCPDTSNLDAGIGGCGVPLRTTTNFGFPTPGFRHPGAPGAQSAGYQQRLFAQAVDTQLFLKGDASTNTASSVDSEVAVFSGTAGKTLKRGTGTGLATLTSGVLSTVAAPTGAVVGTTDTQALTGKTYNKITITEPATGATLTIPDGVTLNAGPGGTLGTAAFTAATAYEVPVTFSTGLTRAANTVSVNAIQNLTKLSNLTSNGFVITSGGDGTLSVDTSTYVISGGALGTPSSGTLTNATGLPIATGVSGLAAGIATFLTTPSSTNLASAVTGETGSGGLVFSSGATLDAPTLGIAAATSIALTGTAGAGFTEYPAQSSAPVAPATGYRDYADATGRRSWIRASDGFTRTWDATLTGNRTYTLPDASGTLLLNGGALGTPASGTLTNATALPISTGVSGLGANVADFLGDPTLAKFNLALSNADVATLGANTFLGVQTITGGTVTASTPPLDITQTWNNAGVTFTGLKLNVTNTASSVSSALMDLRIDNVSKLYVYKSGTVIMNPSTTNFTSMNFYSELYGIGIDGSTTTIFGPSGQPTLRLRTGGITSSLGLAFFAETGAISFGASSDLWLYRDAAANLQLGADAATATAQTLKAHDGLGTDKTGADLTLAGGKGTGTGAGGSLLFKTTPVGTTGSTQNTPVTRLTVPSDGGLQYVTATKPTCDAAHRGTVFYVAGGASVADTHELCAKNSSDVYAWTTLF